MNSSDILKCSYCYYQTERRNCLLNHLKTIHNERFYKSSAPQNIFHCSQCDAQFKIRHALFAHEEKYHSTQKPEKYICMDCGNEYPRMTILRNHIQRRGCRFSKVPIPMEEAVCEICFKKGKPQDIRRHIRIVHFSQYRLHDCQTCGRQFKSTTHLKRHQRVHAPQPIRFPCSVCPKTYSDPDAALLHFRKVHFQTALPESTEKVNCDHCGHVLKRKSHLVGHFATHGKGSQVEFHTCTDCGKILRQKRSMEIHIKLYHPIKKEDPDAEPDPLFNCEKCPYWTPILDRLVFHMRNKHAVKRKKFTCPICLKLLATKASLKDHLGRHSGPGEKQQCDICGIFVCRLKDHKKTHEVREKTFSCDMCPESGFFTHKCVKFHVIEVHLKNPTDV